MIFFRFRDPLVAARRPPGDFRKRQPTPLARRNFPRVCIVFPTVRCCKLMTLKANPEKIHISRLTFLIYVTNKATWRRSGGGFTQSSCVGPREHSTGGGHQRPAPNAETLDTRHHRRWGGDTRKSSDRPRNPYNSGPCRNSAILPFRGAPRGSERRFAILPIRSAPRRSLGGPGRRSAVVDVNAPRQTRWR